ncbi:MAG: dihydrolipoyl dehydrogenase family protein [Candidatus Acidiferrales bacterium]
MTTDSFDVAVIGAGSAGLVAATTARRLGASVLLVEAERVGGDCTWTGCVPSKALIHAATVAHRARRAGWLAAGEPDFGAVMGQVRRAIDRVYQGETPERLRELGIDVRIASAHFRDRSTLIAGGQEVRARKYIVCTGAVPTLPSIPGLTETPHLTYLDVFDLKQLPRRLLVLGAGPVGAELAQAFARLGSRVTVLDAAQVLLPVADPEASRVLADVFAAEGVGLRLDALVSRIKVATDGVVLHDSLGSITGDQLLVATGRRPRIDGLGLENAAIRASASGIEVDQRLRTTNPNVYAAGDVAGSLQFTHYAAWQGFVAARNALFPGSGRGMRGGLPWAVFTDPVVAQVGLGEKEARDHYGEIQVHRLDIARVDRAQTDQSDLGFIKLVARKGRLLGACVVSVNAGEMVNELSTALDARLGLRELADTIHVYPTFGFGIQQIASEASLGLWTTGWRRRLARVVRTRE